MRMNGFDFLMDVTEPTTTRFITFIAPSLRRYDLAVTATKRFFGKKLVTDLQRGVAAVIGPDDAREDGVLEAAFGWSAEEADEVRDLLAQLAGADPSDTMRA
jgi:hypothetical protein